MAAGTLNILIEQGATFKKTIIYRDGAGNLVNLSNVTEARAQMRPTVESDVFTDFVVEVDADPASGKLHWSMAASVTETLAAPLTRVYDLEIEFSNGDVVRLLKGNVTISLEVTRDE